MDWRVVFGLSITLIWITGGLLYLLGVVGWSDFLYLPTADIGSFLEGAFAPLAFLWLVLGHFIQQKEISANTKAINLQEMSARRLELHSRRDSYFKLLSLVQDQLGSIAGFHYMSICGPTGTGEISQEEFSEQRTHANTGDHAWFIRKMLGLAITHRDDDEALYDIFFGTEIRARHSHNFCNTFTKLLEAARQVDTEEMVTGALLYGSAAGMLYRVIRHATGQEPMDPITGLSGAPPPVMEAVEAV